VHGELGGIGRLAEPGCGPQDKEGRMSRFELSDLIQGMNFHILAGRSHQMGAFEPLRSGVP